MRATVDLDELTRAFDDYEEELYARTQAAIENEELIDGIDPTVYYTIAQKSAFAILKEARKLAGYK